MILADGAIRGWEGFGEFDLGSPPSATIMCPPGQILFYQGTKSQTCARPSSPPPPPPKPPPPPPAPAAPAPAAATNSAPAPSSSAPAEPAAAPVVVGGNLPPAVRDSISREASRRNRERGRSGDTKIFGLPPAAVIGGAVGLALLVGLMWRRS